MPRHGRGSLFVYIPAESWTRKSSRVPRSPNPTVISKTIVIQKPGVIASLAVHRVVLGNDVTTFVSEQDEPLSSAG